MDDVVIQQIEALITGDEKLPTNVNNRLVLTAILYLAKTGKDDREEIKSRTVALKSSVDSMNILLTGNGHPENGLILRVVDLEKVKGASSKFVWIVISVLVAGMLGLFFR